MVDHAIQNSPFDDASSDVSDVTYRKAAYTNLRHFAKTLVGKFWGRCVGVLYMS